MRPKRAALELPLVEVRGELTRKREWPGRHGWPGGAAGVELRESWESSAAGWRHHRATTASHYSFPYSFPLKLPKTAPHYSFPLQPPTTTSDYSFLLQLPTTASHQSFPLFGSASVDCINCGLTIIMAIHAIFGQDYLFHASS